MSKPEQPPKLKPHPRLFVILCIVFALWMALLLVLYFLTVYPRRHPSGNRASFGIWPSAFGITIPGSRIGP